MDPEIENAVVRAIEAMHANLGEQLMIDDLARAAIFSKFHFSRVFHRATGLSPGRFLSALRLEEAKRLLSSTSLGVTEISHQVGYSSVGTFSSRFKSSVGASPTKYRQLGQVAPQPVSAGPSEMTVRGDISSPLADVPVFAGLFPDRILQGHPVRFTVLSRPGPFALHNVPPGEWHLLIRCVGRTQDTTELVQQCVGHVGPITVSPLATGSYETRVNLRPVRLLDPPALFALPDLHALVPAG